MAEVNWTAEAERCILAYGHSRIAHVVRPDEAIDILILGVFHGALEIDRYLP